MSFSLINAFISCFFLYAFSCSAPIGRRFALHQLSASLFPVNSLVSQPVSAHRRHRQPMRLAEKVSAFKMDPPSTTDWQLGQTKSFSWLVAWQTLQAFKGKQKALASLHWESSNLNAQNLFVPSTLLCFSWLDLLRV